MRTVLTKAALSACVLLGAAMAAAAAPPEPVKPPAPSPGVHRMVITIGGHTTVRYFGEGLSPGEDAALRDLERAENETLYASDMQDLRRQYVSDELALVPRRRAVQQTLYGVSVTDSSFTQSAWGGLLGYGAYPGWGGYGYGGFGWPGFGYGGYGGFLAGTGGTTNRSLANGVGDEGVMKDEMAKVIAQHSGPEYAAAAARAYGAALARAGESDTLRAGLNLGKGPILAVGSEQQRHVKLTFKDDKTLEGTLLSEDADWITVDANGEDVSVRKADVTRISRSRPK